LINLNFICNRLNFKRQSIHSKPQLLAVYNELSTIQSILTIHRLTVKISL
jgi:hypothetical protein